jgi:acyl dehydratase
MSLQAPKIKVGDTYSECVAGNSSRTHLVQYACASGDYSPLHTDEVYTVQAAGYKVCLHTAY